MNEKNTLLLYQKYSKLFKQHKLSCQQTAMCYGFQNDDGWFWLIDSLCNSIQAYINNNKKEQIEFTCIKEKFGGLRIYATNTNDVIFGMITFAECLSYFICERCGRIKNVKQYKSKFGYIKTLCSKCGSKYK